MSRSLILGTAGHIDHGKTALVQALTGIDTDRLKEEKERGITIDLGFAEWTAEEGGADAEEVRWGVVDVPGHEGFIRNMLAGATGMDVVLMVVAADESVMPQTREHLAIVSILGVEQLVVALTKTDLVEGEWLELVEEEVRELLGPTPFAGAAIVRTSARTGEGLDRLGEALRSAARASRRSAEADVARLPIDRVFTVHGTGTVVTGTLWSGALAIGDQVAIEPGGPPARVRGLQVHGRDVDRTVRGQRTAVALGGAGIDRESVRRGQALLRAPEWPATHMLTVRLRLIPETAWTVQHNQRVRVHVGTHEALARVVMLENREAVAPGEAGWVQLRLETPVVARARERFVLRSYSPMTTIGGGTVAEPLPPKRKRLNDSDRGRMEAVLQGSAAEVVRAVVALGGASGASLPRLPVMTGLADAALRDGVESVLGAGAVAVADRLIGEDVVAALRRSLEEAVDAVHQRQPLRPGAPLETLRASLPPGCPPEAADRIIADLVEEGRLAITGNVVSRVGFEPTLNATQESLRDAIEAHYREAGWAPPRVDELPDALKDKPDLWPLLRLLEARGVLRALEDEHFIDSASLDDAIAAVRSHLSGRAGLGPADFREALPLTRKHLIPILGYLDRTGVTEREGESRRVP